MTGRPANRTREATLVLVGSDGAVRGKVGPVILAEPWWQETGWVDDMLPGAAVLRLLDGRPDPDGQMGGQVTYLVEHDGPVPADLPTMGGSDGDGSAVEWADPLDDHPLRMPWARVGGPAADLRWATTRIPVDTTRRPRQHRTWNLAAIWSIPVNGGGPVAGDGANDPVVWLKSVPRFLAHERAVLQILDDQAVPRLIATDGHRLLLEPMAGSDGYNPSADEGRAMIDSLVDLQLVSSERIDELLAAGVPDLRTAPLVEELTGLVHRLAPDDEVLGAAVDTLGERLGRVGELGLPTVLVHGDPHGGNCRRDTDPVLWFDWGDSFIGNPLLDVAARHRLSDTTVHHWLDRWATIAGTDEVIELWPLLQPLAMLRLAWVYQRFCDNIEPTERIYHQTDVAIELDATRSFLSGQLMAPE